MLRQTLPTGVVTRLLQTTHLTLKGDEILVYETGDKYEPNPHIAVINDGQRVADFSLARLFEEDDVGETYALFESAEFAMPDKSNAFIAAFRNIGNGAGTLFVLLAHRNGQYQVFWQQRSRQAQIKITRNGRLQLWDSSKDGQCVWCPHHYEIRTFAWRGGKLAEVSRTTTRHALNPQPISAVPIKIEK